MLAWAGNFCVACSKLLDKIDSGAPDSLRFTIDWAVKYHVFRAALPENQWRANMRKMWALDIHFSDDKTGMFRILDSDGYLDHRAVAGLDDATIMRAMESPPAGNRAEVRGTEIKKLFKLGIRARADWSSIVNLDDALKLDLGDPFATTGTTSWEKTAAENERHPPNIPALLELIQSGASRLRPDLHTPYGLYEAGRMAAARKALDTVDEASLRGRELWMFWEEQAWVSAASGNLSAVDAALDKLANFEVVPDKRFYHSVVLTWFLTRLAPTNFIASDAGWFRSRLSAEVGAGLQAHLSDNTLVLLVAALHSPSAPTEARRLLLDHVIETPGLGTARVCARALTFLADCAWREGNVETAVTILAAVSNAQATAGWAFERAHFSLPLWAKVESARGNTRKARWCLIKAAKSARQCGAPLAEVRALLLLGRILRQNHDLQRIKSLRDTCSALATDPTLTYILEHWDAWTRGGGSPPAGADQQFWGL